MVGKETSFEEFQDGCRSVEWNDLSNSESLCHCDASHQVSAQSDLGFGRRCHLKNFKMATMVAILDIRTILATLNLCVTVMPPIKFWLNPTFGCGGDVIWRISRWRLWRPSWILEWNNFSNSESLSLWCLPSSFSSIGLRVWEEMSFEEFQDGHHGGHLEYGNVMILAILNLCVTVMPPIKFQLNQT